MSQFLIFAPAVQILKIKLIYELVDINFVAGKINLHISSCVFLQVSDVTINACHARPVRITWRDTEGSPEIPLGALHRILAQDPSLGLSLLRGMREWETGLVAADVWDTSKGLSGRVYRGAGWGPVGGNG